jgi:hypothetical protein
MPLNTVLSQTNPVHTFASSFPMIHSNIMFPSTRRSSVWSRPFRFSDQKFCTHFSHHSCVLHAPPISSSMTLFHALFFRDMRLRPSGNFILTRSHVTQHVILYIQDTVPGAHLHPTHRYHCPSRSTRMYPKVSGLVAWSENCKWYRSLPLGAVISLFCESV